VDLGHVHVRHTEACVRVAAMCNAATAVKTKAATMSNSNRSFDSLGSGNGTTAAMNAVYDCARRREQLRTMHSHESETKPVVDRCGYRQCRQNVTECCRIQRSWLLRAVVQAGDDGLCGVHLREVIRVLVAVFRPTASLVSEWPILYATHGRDCADSPAVRTQPPVQWLRTGGRTTLAVSALC
jgi:hypothetical protein